MTKTFSVLALGLLLSGPALADKFNACMKVDDLYHNHFDCCGGAAGSGACQAMEKVASSKSCPLTCPVIQHLAFRDSGATVDITTSPYFSFCSSLFTNGTTLAGFSLYDNNWNLVSIRQFSTGSPGPTGSCYNEGDPALGAGSYILQVQTNFNGVYSGGDTVSFTVP